MENIIFTTEFVYLSFLVVVFQILISIDYTACIAWFLSKIRLWYRHPLSANATRIYIDVIPTLS